jgi:muramoyltetrapeptide carboxypeptidase LdcA involved in peptidoglycan recycling
MPSVDALTGGVLFVETSEERPSEGKMWRLLLGLGERGVLGAVDAILVGRPKARDPFEDLGPDARAEYRERQYDLVTRAVAEYNPCAAVVCGIDVGYTHPTAPLPVGGRCLVPRRPSGWRFPGRGPANLLEPPS